MKSLLSLVLSLAICLSLSAPALAVDLSPQNLALGSVIEGFKLKEKAVVDTLASETWTFEHIKTGATLVYFKNDDLNRSFDIAFRTPPVDNTGVNHIVEHALISSSNKYPGNDVFFAQLYKTYNTFVNAFTYANMTTYPSATLSEAQLLKMADITLDMMFNSTVKKEENIFKREGWRYSLSAADAPLQRVGIVYSEMKGNDTMEIASFYNAQKALFPNSLLGNNSGGDPNFIPTLTYAHFLNTVDTYYHPSNALVLLYGDLEYAEFFKLIDSYFAKFEKKDVKVDSGKTTPLTAPVTAAYEFPVSANSKTESMVNYSYAFNDCSVETILDLSILTAVLNHQGGPLMPTFKTSKLGSQLTVSSNWVTPHPVLSFSVNNADPQKSAEIQTLIDNALAQAAKGLDPNILEAVIAQVALSTAVVSEDSDLGVSASNTTALVWATTGNPKYYEMVDSYMKKLPELASSQYFEKLLKANVIDNQHKALTTTTAVPGLAEKNATAELAELEKIKNAMSAAEIQALVAETAAFEAWNKSSENQTDISSLQAVTVSELPIEVKDFKVSDTKKDGLRLLTTPTNATLTGITGLAFDSRNVPVEKLHYLNLFASLLGNVKTENYSVPQLTAEVSKQLGSFQSSASLFDVSSGYEPVLYLSWVSLMDHYETSLDLVTEMLTKSDLGDLESLKPLVKQMLSMSEQSLQLDPLNYIINRATADWGEEYAYINYISGIAMIEFLRTVDKALEENPASVVEELRAIQKMVIGKDHVTALFTSDEKNIATFEKATTKLMAKLPENKIVPNDYSKIPVPTDNEALAIDGEVCYNILDLPASALSKYDNSEYTVLSQLVTNDHMLKNLRLNGGAYGAAFMISEDGILAYSHRDPNIKETYDVFGKTDAFMSNLKLTQADLDSYIMNTLGALAKPTGALTEGLTSITSYLNGQDAAFRKAKMKNVRSTTPANVDKFVALLKLFSEKGQRTTAANLTKIEANQDLFDSLVKLTKEIDNTAPVTREAFLSALFAGAPNAIELCQAQKILKGDETGNLLLDKGITKEEAATFLDRIFFADGYTGDMTPVKDSEAVSPWASTSVMRVASSKLMPLNGDGNFDPKAVLTGADLSTLVSTLLAMQQATSK